MRFSASHSTCAARAVGLLVVVSTSCGSADDAGLVGASNEVDARDAQTEMDASTTSAGTAGISGDGGGRSGLDGAATGGGAGGSIAGAGGVDTDAASGTGGVITSGGGDGCVETTLYADTDGDSFGDPNVPTTVCAGTAGFVENNEDCYDGNGNAKPGQMDFFPMERGDGSFDYDCDGQQTVQSTAIGACTVGVCVVRGQGWQTSVPACGQEHPWVVACTGLAFCGPQTEPRTQGCR